jgi:hypothetical protein
VLNEFLDQVAQMSLAEYHVLVQTLVLYGSHKSLRIRIAIGTVRWDLHALYTRRFENRHEPIREQWISIVDQILRASKKSFHRIRQISGDLLHPLLAWVDRYSGDLDRPALQFNHEEHHVPNHSEWAQSFHAEEVTGIQRVPVHFDEPLPRPLLLSLGRRLDSRLIQDVSHCASPNFDLQSCAKRVPD